MGKVLIIRSELIYEYTIYKCPIPIQELRAEEGGGLIIYNGLIGASLSESHIVVSSHAACGHDDDAVCLRRITSRQV